MQFLLRWGFAKRPARAPLVELALQAHCVLLTQRNGVLGLSGGEEDEIALLIFVRLEGLDIGAARQSGSWMHTTIGELLKRIFVHFSRCPR